MRLPSPCGPLPAIRVQAGKEGSKGSFTRLSGLLGSQLCAGAEPLTLNALWDSLPENRLAPLEDAGEARRTPLFIDHRFLDREPHPLVSVTVAYFPPWVVKAADGHAALAAYLESFPTYHPGTLTTAAAGSRIRPRTSPGTTMAGASWS